MATLNVKSVPEPLYLKLKERARRRRRSLSQEVIHLLAACVEADEPQSILALKGLGKGAWQGVDPADHVEAERSAWD